jgi:RNA polymerase sigma-70 factor (ECF subfamily)
MCCYTALVPTRSESVCRKFKCRPKAGLTDGEAQKVVQEVIVSVSQKMHNLGFDPSKGSFKGWVLHVTRWRIIDKLRKKRDSTV